VFVGMDWITDVGIPEAAALLIPAFAFYLALVPAIGRSNAPLRRVFMVLVVTGGWYAAYQSAIAIEKPLYLAGAISGAIGGAAMFIVLLAASQGRAVREAALLIAAGTAIGALCLPAGFLFGATDSLNYLFLTFGPWQIGMGLIVAQLMQDRSPAD
jgi:hypothetical protein